MSTPETEHPRQPEEERKLTRRTVIAAGAVAAAGTGIGMGVVLATKKPSPPRLATRMTARYRSGALPVGDPASGDWHAAKAIGVTVQPQQIVAPILHEGSLERIDVRALHNGSELGFLIEWDDPDADDLDGIHRFHDAVAVQLPAKAGSTPPSVTMGGPGQPVHILQWRASWQRDIAGGRTGPQTLYPRLVRDLTPDELLGPKVGAQYSVGRFVGNPLATDERSPVEEIVAEGFGSATHLREQRARGTGVFDEGRWRVAVALPMKRPEAGAPLAPGSSWPVAFAVWLGSKDNRGARKHWANWVRVDLEAT